MIHNKPLLRLWWSPANPYSKNYMTVQFTLPNIFFDGSWGSKKNGFAHYTQSQVYFSLLSK